MEEPDVPAEEGQSMLRLAILVLNQSASVGTDQVCDGSAEVPAEDRQGQVRLAILVLNHQVYLSSSSLLNPFRRA